MKKSPFAETQLVSVLKEACEGLKVEEICRKHGISPATLGNWKSKYGGLEVNDVKRMKELEEVNGKLNWMFTDMSLENHALKNSFPKRAGDLRPEGVGGLLARRRLGGGKGLRRDGLRPRQLLLGPQGLAPNRCRSDGCIDRDNQARRPQAAPC